MIQVHPVTGMHRLSIDRSSVNDCVNVCVPIFTWLCGQIQIDMSQGKSVFRRIRDSPRENQDPDLS